MKTKILFIYFIIFLGLCCCVIASSKTELEESLDEFETWYWGLQKNENPKTLLKIVPGEEEEVGVFAKTNIKAGEEILRVTWNLMITSERILEVTELQDFIDQESWGWNDTDVIAFYLLYLKKCGPQINPWANWLVTLPEKFTSILYFKEDEVKLLEGTSSYGYALNRRIEAKMSWETIQKEILKKKEFQCKSKLEFKDWKWALSVVASRKVLLFDGKKRFATVIPYFDFFNHYTAPVVKPSFGFIADAKIFHVEAPKTYLKGQQIMQHYGNLGNSELLIDYGFTLAQNTDTTVHIRPEFFGVAPEDPWFDQKMALLEPLLSKPSDLFITKAAISEKVLTAAKIVVSAPDDYEDGEEMTKLKKKASVTAEFELARWFRGVVSHLLSQYPTTLEDDEKHTKSSIFTGSSARAQMAIEVRIEEKQILKTTEQFWAGKQKAILEAVEKLRQQDQKEEL